MDWPWTPCRRLARTGGTVIWTRHREQPDLVPTICRWFRERELDLVWMSDPDAGFGAHRFAGRPEPLVLGQSMFTFVRQE